MKTDEKARVTLACMCGVITSASCSRQNARGRNKGALSPESSARRRLVRTPLGTHSTPTSQLLQWRALRDGARPEPSASGDSCGHGFAAWAVCLAVPAETSSLPVAEVRRADASVVVELLLLAVYLSGTGVYWLLRRGSARHCSDASATHGGPRTGGPANGGTAGG